MSKEKKLRKYAERRIADYVGEDDSLARLKQEQRAAGQEETLRRKAIFKKAAVTLASVVAVFILTFCLIWFPSSGIAKETGEGEIGRITEDAATLINDALTGAGGKPKSYYIAHRTDYSYADAVGEIEAPSGASDLEQPRAGQITAKAMNDNDDYAAWRSYFAAATDNDPAGKFERYTTGDWAFDTAQRVKVTVRDGEDPVFGAEVVYYDAAQVRRVARTGIDGVAYLFPGQETGAVTVKSGESERQGSYSLEARDLLFDLTESEAQVNVIRIMFVIDATGSMGDEMLYLTTELHDVVRRVTEQAEGVRIDLALLFYRDDGDTEKFYYSEFMTVTEGTGLQTQLNVLSKETATGGGDYPEAMDEALALAAGKDWGDENSTNLLFLVLDAPPHSDSEKSLRTASAVRTASEKGIRICPVLCSGADVFCEYVTRMCALLTGGTSVFVTDDSGIGGSHLDPELPDVTVEKLNDLLVRLIVGYHTGDFGTPASWNAGGEETDPAPDGQD